MSKPKKLIIDMGNILYSTLYVEQQQIQAEGEDDGSFFRHLILSNILNLKRLFRVNSKNVYLAFDHKITWRKQIFKYYKAHRKKTRDDSPIDFIRFFKLIEDFYLELKENFNFKVLKVKYAEADDIIAVLIKRFEQSEFIIVSSDKDFLQLQQYPNVLFQYNAIKREKMESIQPKKELIIKVMNGDSGDGIPNILSDDDTFVDENKRQNRLGPKTSAAILNENRLVEFIKEKDVEKNWKRNNRLINLNKIPTQIEDLIMKKYYKTEIKGTEKKLMAYFDRFKLLALSERIDEFIRY